MNHSFAVKLTSILVIAASLLYYQTVVTARERLTAERSQTIAQIEAYNASLQASEQDADTAASAWQDGSYEGEGSGFGGAVRLSVTISGGKIAAIEVLEAAGEDSAYFSQAEALLDDVIAAQSAEVDTVSGATFSSKGLIEAVQDALGKAVAK